MILQDILRSDLDVVFCGTAASRKSAEAGAYYAKKGNKFYPTLHVIGLTAEEWSPVRSDSLADRERCFELGIGFTDLCKTEYGMDKDLSEGAFDAEAVREKILRYQPKVLAFTSKMAAGKFLNEKTGNLPLGEYGQRVEATHIWILSSPSGAANPHWNAKPWRELANTLLRIRMSRNEIVRTA